MAMACRRCLCETCGSVPLVWQWESKDSIPDIQQKYGTTKIEDFDESMVEHLLEKDQ